jgi:uncharacterized protein YtpQ (UPF0354 family)
MKPLAPLLLVTLALWAGCSKAAVLSPSEFTQEFAESLRQARPGLKVEIVKDLQLKVASASGRDSLTFLDNAYDTYKQDPNKKAEVIQRYITGGFELMGGSRGGVDRTRIVPLIKNRALLETTRQAASSFGAKKAPELVSEEFSKDLVIMYAEDLPKSFRYLTPADLKKANIDLGELRSLACENLKRLLPKIEYRGTNGLYMVTAGGNYEASLLLLDSMWHGGQMNVQGDFVVAIPTRDLLLVTGSEYPEGIEKVKQIVKKASSGGSYRVSPLLFVYRNGKFEEYK